MNQRRIIGQQGGYTVVELIVAMTIFALISVVVVGVLVSVFQASTKTGAARKVQQDARYSLEGIARQARSASIDYAFYTQNASDTRCAFSSGGNTTKALALLYTQAGTGDAPETKRLVYYFDSTAGVIYQYTNTASTTAPTCASIYSAPVDAVSGPSRSKVTAGDVTVQVLTFYISPNQNPYDTTTPCNSSCDLARNTHPRVTILMQSQSVGTGLGVSTTSKTSAVTLETTVNSRAYPVRALEGTP